MTLETFLAPGRFFKGNLHTHSTRSDGLLPPEEVCRRYHEQGYDFICLSDHFTEKFSFPMTDTTALRNDGFTTIIGAELHAPTTELGCVWHILAVGLPLDFAPLAPGETGPEIAARAYEAGAFVVIPHPEWYGLTTNDAATIPDAHAVEVYNHTSQVHVGRGGGVYFLDLLLAEGRRVNALACDDAHFNVSGDQNRDAFGGWCMVKAAENSPEALLVALKAGHYYSSQGPEIHDIRREGDELVVETSPADHIVLAGQCALSAQSFGKGMTSSRLPLDRFAGTWGRVSVLDAHGRSAWSNPIWF
ncbi:MAG: CehA/McbA family metallohydrolase [Paracoccus sp. (in: a-proteobacteria)]|nr:CehA/McbA family metallohydrolase [Paracoccus sp. (in: a-proteobacteria)]